MSEPSPWPRTTLREPATVRGVTLFTAVEAEVTIRPAQEGGIRFITTAHPDRPIPATVAHAVDEPRRTVLAASPFQAISNAPPPPKAPASPTAQTVEHILSALAGFGVTDALVELAGPEIPIGDGSAQLFADALAAAGLVPATGHAEPLLAICPDSPILIEDGGTSVHITPRETPGCSFTYHLDYGPDAPIPPQHATFVLPPGGDPDGYTAQVAPARTFSTLPEVLAFRKMGLFTHLEPSQMLVFGPDGPIDNVLRFEDEPARHKLLDLIGDLSLVGMPLVGEIIARRAGHALNHEMARALLKNFG